MVRTFCMALGEDLGHAIELAHYALFAAGDRDGIVEDGIFGVVAVALVGGLGLVEEQDVVDELLLLLRGLARCVSAYRGFGGSGHDELCNRASWRDEDWNSCCVISKVGERIDGSFELTAAKQSWELCMIDDGTTLMDAANHHLSGDFIPY